MRIGLYVSPAGCGSIAEVLERFARAERDGFHTAWSGQVFEHDLLTLLALAGRETRRIELGSWVVPTPTRHPAALAQLVVTAQQACGGRLALGLGVSHPAVIGRRFGIADPRPRSHLQGTLDVLVPLLREGVVSHRDSHYRVELQIETRDVPPPPLLIGALGPHMLELAGSRSDGAALWLTGPSTLEGFAIPTLRAAAARAGRPSPRIAVGLPIALSDDVSRDRAAADRFLERSARLPAYRRVLEREGVGSPADLAIIGDESVLAAHLDHLEGLGVTDFNAVLFPVEDEHGPARTRDWLAGRARRAAG